MQFQPPVPIPSLKWRKSLYLWNLMIRDSTNNGFYAQTLNAYNSILQAGLHPNNFTFPLLFKACAHIPSLFHGALLHSHALKLGFQYDVFVQSSLIHMYSKCFDFQSSTKVFDEMPTCSRGTVSWNSIISAYCLCSLVDQAIYLLKQMWLLPLQLTASTFVNLLPACNFRQGLSLHCCLFKLGLLNNELPLSNSLMNMYIKSGQINEARSIFDEMGETSIVSWTILIGGYVNVGNVGEAVVLFNQMRQISITPDVLVFVNLISACAQVGNLMLASSVHSLLLKSGCDHQEPIDNLLISMYTRCGDLESARRVFDMVNDKNLFLWTSMISGYTQLGCPTEALDLFERLLRTSVRPNEATLATVLSACADLGSMCKGKEIEEYILLNGLESDRQVQTSLIHMFSKCGSINKAKEVFERVADKDLAVWCAMIYGYAIHGMGYEALSLFHKMQHEEGIKPDAAVYTSILLACSHSGSVEEGLRYFKSMQNDFGIEPSIEHYVCMVDLLGRAGHFDMALETIQEMPAHVQARVWAPLLSACRKHGNIELGEFAARKLLTINPGNTGNYILMANLYTSVGKWKEATSTRCLMNDKQLVKEPGWSQVEIDGSVHIFVAGDRSRHLSVDIYKNLEELNVILLEAGYIAETSMSWLAKRREAIEGLW